MGQRIDNSNDINQQLNVGVNSGKVILGKQTRLSRRFEKLKEEVEKGIQLDEFIDDLIEYNTVLDGKSMPDKLKDGGFSNTEITRAARRKQRYWKKFEKYKFYASAQIIDIELFALIKLNFETYVEPLIEESSTKNEIKQKVNEKVVQPILTILNAEGYEDDILNYTADDILGMIYFLTGKCHINWANYDNI